MESFFLSETVKYLYLLFSNASAVVDYFVLSTEVGRGAMGRVLPAGLGCRQGGKQRVGRHREEGAENCSQHGRPREL